MDSAPLRAPLLGASTSTRRTATSRIAVPCLAIGLLLLMLAVLLTTGPSARLAKLPTITQGAASTNALLILGVGGAAWSNGSRAFSGADDGYLTWACGLTDGAIALVDETKSTLWKWYPSDQQSQSRTAVAATLETLRRPVQCVQYNDRVYVACFGDEDNPGYSGIAIVHVSSWSMERERPMGTHVHHVYPMRDGRTLLYTDVGDPWITPPTLGGLFQVTLALTEPRFPPKRIGPPMHARAAMLPAEAEAVSIDRLGSHRGRSGGDGKSSTSGATPTSMIDGSSSNATMATPSGSGSASFVHIITQEPFGEATRIVTLVRDSWTTFEPQAVAAVGGELTLPAPSLPSDGGADIFALGGQRVFASDRYGGNGMLYELSTESVVGEGCLRIDASVQVGVHPRYTFPCDGVRGEVLSLICSVSRDDGLVTTIDAGVLPMRVVARQPVHIEQPSFAISWA